MNWTRRRNGKRPPVRIIQVFTEGKVTEPEYLDALKADPALGHGEEVRITCPSSHRGMQPLPLVQAAVKYRNEANPAEYDEIWCLFDVEAPRAHPNLLQAVRLADGNDIRCAVSNPCFELWLLLHHQEHHSHISTQETRRLLTAASGRAGKGIDTQWYREHRDQAGQRARDLRDEHTRNGTRFPMDNPSSQMDLFITAVEGDLTLKPESP